MTRTLSLPRASARQPRLGARLRLWHALFRQRRALAGLDAAALEDIGVSGEAARREAGRPFWDAPDNWSM